MAELSDPERVCERCNRINLEDLKGAGGYVHQSSFKALADSASGCMLCKLITEACVHYFHERRMNIDVATGNLGPVRLFATGPKDNFSAMELRTFAVLRERQLSRNVIVIVGELPQKLFVGPSWSILLEMYALKDSSAEEAGILGLREVESYAACEANFSRLRRWLEQCKRKHEMCSLEHIKQLVGTSYMPERLIDLGASDTSSSKPKIIHTRGCQEQYVALSYCWGSGPHFRTEKENFSDMQKSIPVEKLPQTIRDAFFVAQKLDIRYIWIDALCIIQDNDDDWNSEAKRMGAIYANSYFTIAATAAKDSGEGFLSPRTLSRVSVPFRRTATSESEGTVYFRQLSDFLRDHQEYVLKSPLQRRAWVLQETLLSRRTVHFSSKQIYWECRSTFGAEDDTTNDVDCREYAHEFLNILSALQGGMCSEHHAMIFFRIWAKILSRYSTLSISRPSDKLPALSGLASLVERIISWRYLYGIWSFNLPYGLFWQPVSHPIRQADKWRAPSWSWAAWDGEIMFENYFPLEDSRIHFNNISEGSQLRGALKLEGQIGPCYVSLDLQPQPKPCRSDRKLREIPITPHEYAFAENKSKLLEYQACIETIPYDLNGDAPGSSLLRITEGRLMSAQGPGERNVCRFDGERGTETDFFYLRLSCTSGVEFHHCRGLLLRCATGATGVYERVGVGWSTDIWWHTAPNSMVTLV